MLTNSYTEASVQAAVRNNTFKFGKHSVSVDLFNPNSNNKPM